MLTFPKVKCLSVVVMEPCVALSSLTHDMTILGMESLRVRHLFLIFLLFRVFGLLKKQEGELITLY